MKQSQQRSEDVQVISDLSDSLDGHAEVFINDKHAQYYSQEQTFDEFDEAMPQIKNGDLMVDSAVDVFGEDEEELRPSDGRDF